MKISVGQSNFQSDTSDMRGAKETVKEVRVYEVGVANSKPSRLELFTEE